MLAALRMLYTHGRRRTGTSAILCARLTKPWSRVGLEAVQRPDRTASALVRMILSLTRAWSPRNGRAQLTEEAEFRQDAFTCVSCRASRKDRGGPWKRGNRGGRCC